MSLITGERVKPFIKWVGGKTQLIDVIEKNLPLELKNGKIKKYVEPFVGSGAIFFYLISKYDIEEIYINDINSNLINVYNTIKNNVNELIKELEILDKNYKNYTEEERKNFFYEIRDKYNENQIDKIKNATYFIFLNKTCFNGLYRVNLQGKFNVPFGKYKNPKIYDKENLLNVSKNLKKVNILNKDFEELEGIIDNKSFVYFDPPYRPLTATANFTSYDKRNFDDNEQKRLRNFYLKLHNKGAKLMLSNSDSKNVNEDDNFFDKLYSGFRIERVYAKRMVNSKANKRGYVKELLIMNY